MTASVAGVVVDNSGNNSGFSAELLIRHNDDKVNHLKAIKPFAVAMSIT